MDRVPQHIAIIMDGNGRWAKRRGLPRFEGHRHGMKAVRAIIAAAPELGVKFLTLYAFSTENWSRPAQEVAFLMKMCEAMITTELPGMIKNNIRLRHIGSRHGLPESLVRAIHSAEELTQSNDRLTVLLAFNYGARAEIIEAVRFIAGDVRDGRLVLDGINDASLSERLLTAGIPDPDLLIRTSGEMRVSNFLLWQIAYAEIHVVKKYWPDFNRRDLVLAIRDFQKRQRRFGGLDD